MKENKTKNQKRKKSGSSVLCCELFSVIHLRLRRTLKFSFPEDVCPAAYNNSVFSKLSKCPFLLVPWSIFASIFMNSSTPILDCVQIHRYVWTTKIIIHERIDIHVHARTYSPNCSLTTSSSSARGYLSFPCQHQSADLRRLSRIHSLQLSWRKESGEKRALRTGRAVVWTPLVSLLPGPSTAGNLQLADGAPTTSHEPCVVSGCPFPFWWRIVVWVEQIVWWWVPEVRRSSFAGVVVEGRWVARRLFSEAKLRASLDSFFPPKQFSSIRFWRALVNSKYWDCSSDCKTTFLLCPPTWFL